ncbi:hypothetical protein [Streptomyces specialis]|uniref:hypothetical protein n=1 Tax=Streptomyces specialis TaxID=498367 RepID=UPI00073EB601|nr:hypothetical protein [Streptomyces specialis]
MPSLDALFDSLTERRVTGVDIPGYLDREHGHPVFCPWSWSACLRMDSGFLRLDSTGSGGQLALAVVDKVEVPEPLLEGDEEFATTDYGHLFLAEATPRRIVRVRYATNAESVPGLTVRCAEFTFEPHAVLFADPMWTFGIRLSGEGAYDRWVAETRENPELPYQEREWG